MKKQSGYAKESNGTEADISTHISPVPDFNIVVPKAQVPGVKLSITGNKF